MALLVALHRKHALVAAAVGVLGDGALEGSVKPLQPVFEDVVEADQQRQAEVAALQLAHQVHQIQRSASLAAGLHDHVAPLAHGEVRIAPAIDAVESGPVGGAPGGARGGGGAGSGLAVAGVGDGRGAGGIGEHHGARGGGIAVEQNLGVPFQPEAAGRHLNRHGLTPEAIDDPIDTLANPAELAMA